MVMIPNTPELRALRLWHWRRMKALRAKEHYYEQLMPGKYATRMMQSNRRQANHHLRAVQALNDVCEGTAEQDDHEQQPQRA